MTLFIKAFSIWLVLYSLIIIFKSDYLIHIKSIKSKSSLFWIGVVQLFFSVILFLYSYENSTNYSLVIIAFAILSFLKSISLIFFPEYVLNKINNIKPYKVRIRGVFSAIIGVLLYFIISQF